MSVRQGQNLWKRYKEVGIEGYLIKEYVRNIGKLSSVQISRVLAMTDGEHIMTQKQIASERVFEELRKFLANRVFENKEEIEACLTYWIKDFQQKPEQLIKLTKFHWM
jgi:predicted ATP-dependent Lon-type protease